MIISISGWSIPDGKTHGAQWTSFVSTFFLIYYYYYYCYFYFVKFFFFFKVMKKDFYESSFFCFARCGADAAFLLVDRASVCPSLPPSKPIERGGL